MKKHVLEDLLEVQAVKPSPRARLQALLFTSAALGTMLAALGVLEIHKYPSGSGE